MAKFRWQDLRGLFEGRFLRIWREAGAYRDTLERLIRGDFDDLDRDEKRRTVDRVIEIATRAAVLAGAAPLPFVDVPVQAAMVRAIAKIHGVRGTDGKLILQLGAALGGGALLGQALRLIPLAGGLSRATRSYAATWALGRAADRYYGSLADGEGPLDGARLRASYEADLQERTQDHRERMQARDAESELREVARLEKAGALSADEARARRLEILTDGPTQLES